MGARQVVRSRVVLSFTAVMALILLAGCGRVDLEDLTPEAVRTQQAQEALNTPTPTEASASGTPDANATTPAGGGVDLSQGDIAAGSNIYNATCSGCHEGGRAAAIRGKVFDPAVVIPMLRTGEGFGAPHPKYKPTDIRPLSDEDFIDVFAYLAAQ